MKCEKSANFVSASGTQNAEYVRKKCTENVKEQKTRARQLGCVLPGRAGIQWGQGSSSGDGRSGQGGLDDRASAAR